MLWKVLAVVAVVVAAFFAFVALRPASYRVERSIVVAAPPERIFALVADLRRMDEWSPWAKLDPKMQKHHEGEPGQPGSSYRWAGNDAVGEGRMTVVEVVAPSRVSYRLEFLKPFESVATTGFQLVPEGARTKVSWGMEGRLGFVEKLVGVFTDMNAMIAKDFDEGLASLKALAERPEAAVQPGQGS